MKHSYTQRVISMGITKSSPRTFSTSQMKGLLNGPGGGGRGVLPYMSYIGMCRCEGYGFQPVYSRIGYINQSVWV